MSLRSLKQQNCVVLRIHGDDVRIFLCEVKESVLSVPIPSRVLADQRKEGTHSIVVTQSKINKGRIIS